MYFRASFIPGEGIRCMITEKRPQLGWLVVVVSSVNVGEKPDFLYVWYNKSTAWRL